MKLCAKNHVVIVYTVEECPLCESIEEKQIIEEELEIEVGSREE